ncbi:DUF6551 family protein [Sphingomonas sp. ACRSK]|uniref:DUF6551 family protein n=1 Tax=Sphingomonas sp. ACRSK TaxID=2918213 RepID=UPI001EF6CB31|nr:DUF6551 family protein [Sphingomonas sp. ACRSK]MCG7346602.1 hypothetical protein [Sphingomonas sp. ACRSK]
MFDVAGRVFACPPRLIQEKLKAVAGETHEVVVGLASQTEAIEAERLRPRRGSKERGNVLDPDYQLKLKPMIGAPCTPAFIPIEQLKVDDTYQRSIEGGASRKLIVKIAENWDWRLCLPLLVSRRPDGMYVIDGQHRKEAADLRGDIQHLACVVFDFDDPKAEAELFVQANRSRRAMSTLDDFHAAVVAGDPKAVAANDVVTAAGLTVGRIQAWQYWKPGEVIFIKAIQRALNTHGKQLVGEALSMIARAFEGQTLVGVGAVFEGLIAFMQARAKAENPIEPSLMEMMLTNVGIPGWKEAVEGYESSGERADAMLKAISDAYSEAEAQ